MSFWPFSRQHNAVTSRHDYWNIAFRFGNEGNIQPHKLTHFYSPIDENVTKTTCFLYNIMKRKVQVTSRCRSLSAGMLMPNIIQQNNMHEVCYDKKVKVLV